MARVPLTTEMVKCRTWGHAWEDYTPIGKRRPGWGTSFTLLCTRCGMQRHDTIDSLGDLSSRHYDQPEGYKLAADETPTRSQLRLDLMKRMRSEGRTTRKRATA